MEVDHLTLKTVVLQVHIQNGDIQREDPTLMDRTRVAAYQNDRTIVAAQAHTTVAANQDHTTVVALPLTIVDDLAPCVVEALHKRIVVDLWVVGTLFMIAVDLVPQAAVDLSPMVVTKPLWRALVRIHQGLPISQMTFPRGQTRMITW